MNLQKQIDELLAERASQWLDSLRQESQPDYAAFLAWVAESPRNLDEFLSMAALDQELGEPSLYAGLDRAALMKQIEVPVASVPRRPRPPEKSPRWHWPSTWNPWTLAASVALAISLAFWALRPQPNTTVTAIGEQRSLRLPDGSLIYLNARSRLEVRYDDTSREVLLEDGEALFDVAPQPRRPFKVRTRSAVIEALGTQFNVSSRASETRVAVLEGKVQVSHAEQGNAETAALNVGQTVKVSRTQPMHVVATADVENLAAWRERRLVFARAPLEEVVEEFNRFNYRPIRLEGVHGAERHYSGTFDANDPQALVAFLQREPDLDVQVTDREIVIRGRSVDRR